MTQRHKHYDAIVAYAEGKQIQWRHNNTCAWQNWGEQGLAPAFECSNEYRVKPATIKVWVALFRWSYGSNAVETTELESVATSWAQDPRFVKWIMEGEEVEV